MGRKGKKGRHSKPSRSSFSGSQSPDLKNPVSESPGSSVPDETQWDITRRENKARFLEQLAGDEARGVIFVAARLSHVGLTTVYDYMRQDKVFAADVRNTRVAVGGAFVESKLFERIAGVKAISRDGEEAYTMPPCVTAMRTYLLSEIGAEMGYKPVSKTEHSGNIDQGFAILEVPDNGRSVKEVNEQADDG